MTNHAQHERALLCDTALVVGPDAPTLCGDWTVRDLMAHLLVRDRRPDTLPGVVLPVFAHHTRTVQGAAAAAPFAELVESVRGGPPMWSPLRLSALDEAVNTVEYFVHHEDIRRASPSWTERASAADLDAALTKLTTRMSRLLTRRAPVGVALAFADGSGVTAKAGDPSVTVSGDAGEVLLFCFGRQDSSLAGLDGPAAAQARLRTARLGL